MSYKKHLPYLKKPAVIATGVALAFIAFSPRSATIEDGLTNGWPQKGKVEMRDKNDRDDEDAKTRTHETPANN